MAVINDDNVGRVLDGTPADDVINGNGGNDTITPGLGIDEVHGGADNDTIRVGVVTPGTLPTTEILDGGTGTDTLLLNGGTSGISPFGGPLANAELYNAQVQSIERIQFDGGPTVRQQATLLLSQVGNGGLADNAEIVGSANTETIVFFALTAGTYDFPTNFTYTNWTDPTFATLPTSDYRILIGSGVGPFNFNGSNLAEWLVGSTGNDILIGNAGNDALFGMAGIDRMYGGPGQDGINIGNADSNYTEDYSQEVLDGGEGDDLLFVQGNVNFNGTLTSIEGLFFSTGTVHNFEADASVYNSLRPDFYFGTSQGFSTDTIRVKSSTAFSLDMSRWNIQGWEPFSIAGPDKIIVNGSSAGDTVIGTSTDDTLNGGGGDDRLTPGLGVDFVDGGDGNDTIALDSTALYNPSAFEQYHGGSGFDTIEVVGGQKIPGIDGITVPTLSAYITSIEAVTFAGPIIGPSGGQKAISFNSIQIADGLVSPNLSITGDADQNIVFINYFSAGTYSVPMGFTFANRVAVSYSTLDTADGIGMLAQGPGDFTFLGGPDDDLLVGFAGNDTLRGGAGNDVLIGFGGIDIIEGGEGDDHLFVGGIDVSLNVSTFLGEVFDGGNGKDCLRVGGDVLFQGTTVSVEGVLFNRALPINSLTADISVYAALGPNAFLNSGAAHRDTVRITSAGGMTLDISGWQFDSWQASTAFADFTAADGDWIEVVGSGARDVVTGSTSNDVIYGNGGGDTMLGHDGNDRIDGGAGDDEIEGGAGDDQLRGGDGFDNASYATATAAVVVNLARQGAPQATSGAGNDTLSGFEDLTGSAFDDVLAGDAGDNDIFGGAGNDLIVNGLGNDVIDGGTGIDTVAFAGATAGILVNLGVAGPVNTGMGIDTLLNIETVVGTSFGDVIAGNEADNILLGDLGDDVLVGGAGSDQLFGGGQDAGGDLVSYLDALTGVKVSLALTGPQNTLGAGIDLLSGIEHLVGSQFADDLTGDGGVNVLIGAGGADVLRGGGGFDVMLGGDAADYFLFDRASESIIQAPDIILDFQIGQDKLDIRNLWTGAADRFTIGTGGQFTYVDVDQGGNGSVDFRVLLNGNPALTTADILFPILAADLGYLI